MKILSKQLGRIVLMKPLHEIAPLGGVYLPSLFEAVKGRYSFTSVPNMTAAEGYKFQIGRIVKSGRECPIQELTLFPEAVVCTADDTEVAEFFLDDLLTYLRDHFSFRVDANMRRLFLSQVWVQFERSPNRLIAQIEALSKIIGDAQSATYGIQSEDGIQLQTVAFDFDKTQISPLFGSLSAFRIERKNGAPFSENVLFSMAPLRTPDHLRVLTEIETIIAAG